MADFCEIRGALRTSAHFDRTARIYRCVDDAERELTDALAEVERLRGVIEDLTSRVSLCDSPEELEAIVVDGLAALEPALSPSRGDV